MSETTTDAGFGEPVDTTVASPVEAPAAQETTTEPAEPDASVKADDEPKPAEPAPKRRPWWENSIAEARAGERAAKREAEALRAELAKPKTAQPQSTMAETVPATEVETRAIRLMEERHFVEACNDIAGIGEAKYPDFDDAVRNFAMLGEMPKPFLEAVTALGKDEGAKVYYDLGKNPEEAARIFRLPPVRMAMELAKMATGQPKVTAPSKAPPPIEPITSRAVQAGAEPDPDKDAAAWREWFKTKQRR